MSRPPWRPSKNRPQPELVATDALPPSRSDRKRAAQAQRDIATELFLLPDKALAAVPLDTDLRDAVVLGRSIHKHGGRRRQLQLVAKMLRILDTGPITIALDRIEHRQESAILRTHTVEQWRERLLTEGSDAVASLVAEHPGADVAPLEALVQEALRERREGRPQRAFREMFRVLWELLSI